jgi:hypothetical protein
LKWARRLCEDRFLKPLAAGNGEFLTRFHANSNIPKFTGFESVYWCNNEAELHTAAINFWDDVVKHRTWVIGGNSAGEHFFAANEFERHINAPAGPESCNTVNMLRLTEALFRTVPSAVKMDYYERAMWNHILSFHEPERGMFAYYTTMRPGGYRVYSDEFDSMWCCVGTGLECPGKYGQMIYTRTADGSALDVNLFIASELHWAEKRITIKQETRFPEEEAAKITLTMDAPQRLSLRIRHPWWVAEGQLKVSVNSEPVDVHSKPSEYTTIERTWRNGDVVQVTLPMHLSVEPLPHSDRYFAVLHGPIVLSGALGRESDLSKLDFWQIGTTIGRKSLPPALEPVVIADSNEQVRAQIKPAAGKPLAFRMDGLVRPQDVELIPFYKNHYQRYAVYWERMTPAELRRREEARAAALRREEQLDASSIDRVRIGDADSERAHNLRSRNSETGFGAYSQFMETQWRHAVSGGWFSYDVKVSPDRPVKLACTYWGQESGRRTFDVLVDGERVATTSLGDTGKAEFYDVETPIPAELTRGRERVTVRFQPQEGNTAGGLFGLRVLPKSE